MARPRQPGLSKTKLVTRHKLEDFRQPSRRCVKLGRKEALISENQGNQR